MGEVVNEGEGGPATDAADDNAGVDKAGGTAGVDAIGGAVEGGGAGTA